MTDTTTTTAAGINDNEGIAESKQYLTFKLNDEIFALDIARVREVLEHPRITKIPRTPGFMRGVINLRGHVVPVIDIKLKFGMEKTVQTIDSCIIIVEINIEGETIVLGAMADSVREVFELESGQIEPPPRIGTRLDTAFIKGMGKKNDLLIVILDIDRVFSIDELSRFKNSKPSGGELNR